MGLGRKVGAFLGLMPEEQHGYVDDDFAGSDEPEGYPAERTGSKSRSSHLDPYTDPYAGSDRAEPAFAARAVDGHRGAGHHPDAFGSEPAQRAPRDLRGEPMTRGALAVKVEPAPRRETDAAAHRPAAVKLTGFGEARVIGEKYRDGQSVILDMTEMTDSDARRLVDFSAGLAFSLRGSIEKVAPKVFMLLPPNAETTAGLLADARAYASR